MENNEISFVLLDRFVVNAYSTEFSRFNFRVIKLIDHSYSYFVFAMRSDTKFPQNLERCYKAQTLNISKAIKVCHYMCSPFLYFRQIFDKMSFLHKVRSTKCPLAEFPDVGLGNSKGLFYQILVE